MKNIVICSDDKRRKKIQSEFDGAGMSPTFMKGVFVNKGDVLMGHEIKKPGNVGCMLAKLKAWELVASFDEPCNIFEDDEVIPKDYLAKRDAVLGEAQDYDFVFLNALRPSGVVHSEQLLRVSKVVPNREPEKNYCRNVWNSNYAISPRFAREMSSLLILDIRLGDVFWRSTSDWVISEILHEISPKRKIFTVKESDLISRHDETVSIRKSKN